MILFTILMFVIFGRMIGFALRAAWGLTKAVFAFFILPMILIGLVVAGLMRIAWPIILIVAIVMLIRNDSEGEEVC